LIVFLFLTKKVSQNPFYPKIYRLLNTKRQFISHEKSQIPTNFVALKKFMIVLIEYHKISLYFIQVFIEYY